MPDFNKLLRTARVKLGCLPIIFAERLGKGCTNEHSVFDVIYTDSTHHILKGEEIKSEAVTYALTRSSLHVVGGNPRADNKNGGCPRHRPLEHVHCFFLRMHALCSFLTLDWKEWEILHESS